MSESKRIFKYNGQTYQDPGPEYNVEEIKKHLAGIFPEVSQAAVEEKTLEDGTLEITFVKRAGTKGIHEGTRKHTKGGHDLRQDGDRVGAQRTVPLLQVAPVDLAALRLWDELHGIHLPNLKNIAARRDEIEAALSQLEKHIFQTQKLSQRCENLPPTPAHHIPTGI